MKSRDFSRYAEFVRRDYRKLVREIRAVARESGMILQEIGGIQLNHTTCSIYRVLNRNSGPSVCISSVMHGDEYEGVFALLEFLRRNQKLIRRFNLTGYPVLNPLAYIEGKKDLEDVSNSFGEKNAPLEVQIMQENLERAQLFIDLHYDDSDKGISCYERRRRRLPSLGRRIITRLKPRFKIDTTDDNGTKNRQGVLRTNRIREKTIESYMFKRGALWSLTLEVALSLEPFEKRVAYGYSALKAGLEEFWKLKHKI